MADLLRMYAAAQPDTPALIEGERVVSWAERDERARRAANALQTLGVGQGGRVALMAYHSIAGFEVSGALTKLEAIGVPVNFRLRGAELAYILNDSGVRAVCAGPEFLQHLEAARPEVVGEVTFAALAGAPVPDGWVSFEELLAAASSEQPQ